MNIDVVNPELKSSFKTNEEKYTAEITSEGAKLKSDTYVGFVRALETFMQSITCNKKATKCSMSYLPITIEDEPAFSYRSVMIDSARHYIPIHLIF